ncbi:RagB/SusD family nutrient uptake outer membrane protein [Hymenobacter sp. HMF4947]|uniref:RagB/SusD family nutrient uptake outer membrane protein n=1 Tax=Hymenobacter ginkgonis TaxID=2682976 RepID=A0A7K1T9M5_9BACT|nr:RagB/SusD family nutrient uptake outer membrane protein [Hymenobacter ginkgonis]MVN75100.1 RagB/SusD family nutrient uptake outer membrane protein [Hymenobacter ginkgonis]
MINTKYTCGAFLLSLGLLTGCGEKFLDEKPADQITDANFYQTQTDAIQAVTASYSELTKEGQYNAALWAMDIMADISTVGGGGGGDGIEYQQLENFSIPTTNFVATRLWQGSYIGLGRCNIVLQKVPLITNIDPAIQKRCLGEAQFLRAKFYFDLVRAFGDVPLLLTPPASVSDANIARSPAADVYKQIEQDLLAAITNLPTSYSGADLGRATKWAATGLLAKVYLTEGNKTGAAEQARAVINGSGKSMWANYGDNFKVENENGKESLFEIQYINGRNQYDRNSVGFAGNEFFGPRGQGITPQNGYGFNVPEPDFVNGYEAGDTRKAVTIWAPGDTYPADPTNPGVRTQPKSLPGSPFGYDCKKWFVGKVNTNVWDSPLNIPVLRLAEMYLILAEAVGPTTEGLEAINKVRRRSFGLDYNTPSAAHDLTASSGNFTDAVIRERKYELAFEFDRWFDLKRLNGTANGLLPVMTAQTNYLRTLGIQRGTPTANNLVLPIPQSERDANPNLSQNPGY